MQEMFIQGSFIDDLLQRIGYKLQISPTQRNLAEMHYNAVAKWLTLNDAVFKEADVDIYPQGSLRIGTTVKPLKQQEYDLDLVIEIKEDWMDKDPIDLLNKIEKRLKENATYKPMVERKNRCIRLNYEHEFHMDILPAHPADTTYSTCVKVPDRKAEDWKDSNPKGYAQWFDKRSIYYQTLLEKKAKIDPLPDDDSFERKPPLKRAVQLIKRFRDVYFEDNPDQAPISIVLTTLSGHLYKGESSVAEALTNILNGIVRLIPTKEKLVVRNPSNELEILSERWNQDPELYKSFVTFVHDFKERWDNLSLMSGLDDVTDELKAMFGEDIVMKSFREQTLFVEKNRSENKLGVLSGIGLIITSSSLNIMPVRNNTFYGD